MPSSIHGRDSVRHQTQFDDTFIFNPHHTCAVFKLLVSHTTVIFLLNFQMFEASVEIKREKVTRRREGKGGENRRERRRQKGRGEKRGEGKGKDGGRRGEQGKGWEERRAGEGEERRGGGGEEGKGMEGENLKEGTERGEERRTGEDRRVREESSQEGGCLQFHQGPLPVFIRKYTQCG